MRDPGLQGYSRRAVLASALATASLVPCPRTSAVATTAELAPLTPRAWTPLAGMSTGVGVLRSVEQQYSTTFAAYLARFLVNWEPVTRRWWEERLAESEAFTMDESADDGIVGMLGEERQDLYLATRFSSLVTSVELGLQSFEGPGGVVRLATSLKARYTTTAQKRALA